MFDVRVGPRERLGDAAIRAVKDQQAGVAWIGERTSKPQLAPLGGRSSELEVHASVRLPPFDVVGDERVAEHEVLHRPRVYRGGINPLLADDYTHERSSATTTTPHDALFKAAFETPEQAAALFKQLLPPIITEAIAWDTLARESGTFVDPALRKRQSDLLFSVKLADLENQRAEQNRSVLVYLLLEHQSSNDNDMLLRMLEYLVRIWKRHRKANKGRLPIIIPTLISNAPGGWSAPIVFHELFDLHPDAIPGLASLVPNFTLLLQDLTRVDDDELLSWMLLPAASLILKVLRDARHKDSLLQNLDKWRGRVREALAQPGGRAYIEQWLHYIWLVTPDLDFDEVHATLLRELPETKEVAMTFAERLEERGKARGKVEAQVDMLTKQMRLKFGELTEEHVARLSTATAQQLEGYVERILTASTPEEMFATQEPPR
jgi:predicted transposase YdaD